MNTVSLSETQFYVCERKVVWKGVNIEGSRDPFTHECRHTAITTLLK